MYSMLWPLSVNSQKYQRTVGYPSSALAGLLVVSRCQIRYSAAFGRESKKFAGRVSENMPNFVTFWPTL